MLLKLSPLLLLVSCALPQIAINREPENEQGRRLDPETKWFLFMQSVPQDDHYHFGGKIERVRDRVTDEPIGWNLGVSVRRAWDGTRNSSGQKHDLFVKRPRYPRKTWPPE